jgi:hypothetical protein
MAAMAAATALMMKVKAKCWKANSTKCKFQKLGWHFVEKEDDLVTSSSFILLQLFIFLYNLRYPDCALLIKEEADFLMGRSVETRKRILPAIGGLLVAWGLLSVASYFLLVLPRQHLNDFYPRWEGAQAVLAGENPYSEEVSLRIQKAMFGRAQEPHEVLHHFAYPATITWLLLPFFILPYLPAASLWHGFLFILLLVCPLVVISLLDWRLNYLQFVVLLVFSVLIYRYSMIAYMLGQFIPLNLAGIVLAWWGTQARNSAVAFIGLATLLVRPEVVILPAAVLLLHNWLEQKKEVVIAFFSLAFFLWLLTRIWIGAWEVEFINALRIYSGSSYLLWPPLVFGSVWIAALLAIAVIIWAIWIWVRIQSLPGSERLPWEISAAVLVTLMIFPQTNSYTSSWRFRPFGCCYGRVEQEHPGCFLY